MTSEDDKLPPNDESAERGILGCILLGGSEADPSRNTPLQGARAAGVGPLWFFDLRNRRIWDAIDQARKKGHPVNLRTVAEELRLTAAWCFDVRDEPFSFPVVPSATGHRDSSLAFRLIDYEAWHRTSRGRNLARDC